MFIEGVEYNEESCKLEESTRTGSSEWSVTECVVLPRYHTGMSISWPQCINSTTRQHSSTR